MFEVSIIMRESMYNRMEDKRIMGLTYQQWGVIGVILFVLLLINVLVSHLGVKDVLKFERYIDNAVSTCGYISEHYLYNGSDVYSTELEAGNYANYVRVERVGLLSDKSADVYLYIKGRLDGGFDVMVVRCTPESYKISCVVETGEGDRGYVEFYGTYVAGLFRYTGERPDLINVYCQ